ncbi:MAG: ABC transporter ATP-binding protein [Ilumatobacter sp.]|uniref:ABC transporter ATP-binding protein n=1 Tax=Ilumatobacter sp. TaxID=1967498 RepID=UPI003298FB23
MSAYERAIERSADPLLRVDRLEVSFTQKRGLFARRRVRAVDDVSFTIGIGETLGLVGESGSGKSTTANAIVRLLEPDAGTIELGGVDITHMSQRTLRPLRARMQMVFQDPYSSLDPSMVVGDSIAEPIRLHDGMSRAIRDERVVDLLESVGLAAHHRDRYPYEFSGGQRQRVAIARALAANPDLIVLDEAVSALDVSTQNQVINLVEDLRERLGLAYLFIAHDLSVVRHISHRVAVMYLGALVEVGPVERVYERPAHPYTEALLSAVPVPDPVRQRSRDRIVLPGDPPDPSAPPAGCRFHTRCAYVMDRCRTEIPPVVAVEGGGEVRCHLHTPDASGTSTVHLGATRTSS